MAAVLALMLVACVFLSLWDAPLPLRGQRGGSPQMGVNNNSHQEHRLRVGEVHGSDPTATRKKMSGVSSVPLLLELLGTALESGLSVQGALRVVSGVAEPGMRECLLQVVAGLEIGASWDDSWHGKLLRNDIAQIHNALIFGALTGAVVGPLLYAEAQQLRRTASRAAEKRAAALGVKLVLPLGLCALPAFIALGVVPVVMAMIPDF